MKILFFVLLCLSLFLVFGTVAMTVQEDRSRKAEYYAQPLASLANTGHISVCSKEKSGKTRKMGK